MFKCDKCNFECASEGLMEQHKKWCGLLKTDGKPMTERQYTKLVREEYLATIKSKQ